MRHREFQTLLYGTDGPIATITLNRPDRLNTIVPPMPDEFEAAVREATLDQQVKVIVVRGAGRAFCAGYDFGGGFHHWDDTLRTDGRWDPGKDFIGTGSYGPTQKFMSLWRTPRPVIAQIHGWCVGGGSDMALCADLIIASEDAQIGTPYSRVRGCYLSGMCGYRLGLTKAKEHALTGSHCPAAKPPTSSSSTPRSRLRELENEVGRQAEQLASIPSSQLAAMKLVVNQTYENLGLHSTQTLGPILDGLMRNTPEAQAFIDTATRDGVRAATNERDVLFGDTAWRPPNANPTRVT